MEISYHVHSILPDLSENVSEGLGWPWSPPYSPCPLRPHSCTWAVLCLSLGARTRTFGPRKVLSLPPHSLFSSHILFFLTTCYYQQSLAVITNNPWSASGLSSCLNVWNMHISPLSSRLLQTCIECKHSAEKPCDFHLSWLPFRCNLMIWLNSNILSTWEGHLQEEG